MNTHLRMNTASDDEDVSHSRSLVAFIPFINPLKNNKNKFSDFIIHNEIVVASKRKIII